MRILVDTSVWSLSLRKSGPARHPAVQKLSTFLTEGEDLFLTGLILQEILQAFRSEATFRRVSGSLEPFPLLEMRRSDFIDAASMHQRCAAKGISVSTADCQIATAAIRHDCMLLSADQDFQRIARHSKLQLA